MNQFRSIALAATVWLAMALPSFAEPVEITDAIGRKVIVNVPAKRVAINFNFEEFTAVAGVEGWTRVVGMSRAPWESWRPVIFDRYKAVIPNLATMPDIGNSDEGTFSAEKVIALKPDVFFWPPGCSLHSKVRTSRSRQPVFRWW